MADIEILNFSVENATYIKTLNVEWLEKYFAVEPNDELQLSNPQTEIIDKGGMIFYAKHNTEIVGTATLLKVSEDVFELSKMAVTEHAQGLGIGKKLMDHCIKVAAQNNIHTLILYSNTKLEKAIALYRKYGFVEVPIILNHYKRANIKMELKM